jgi:hypothetical protein
LKLSLSTLKKIIREELLRGSPDFIFEDFSAELVQKVKKEFEKYLQSNSSTPSQSQELREAAQIAFDELKTEVNDLIQEKIKIVLNKHSTSNVLLSQYGSSQK